MAEPTGKITVGATSTVITAENLPANLKVHAHVEWRNESDEVLMSVDGYTKTKADGSVNFTLGIGSDFVEQHSGQTYHSPYAKLWDVNLEIS